MGGNKILRGRRLEISLRLLHNVTEFLESNNITYWLESGTLLGVVRENRLLPWDNDLDISIIDRDADKLIPIFYKLWFRGYKTRVFRHKKQDAPFVLGKPRILKVFNSLVGSVFMDIFVKTKYEDHYYWAVGAENYSKKRTPAHFYENLTKVVFNGKEYNVPAAYEDYLAYRYGDWRTTKREWDFSVDDRAIVGH
jgi:phosphorylcholine metabolism protein LicD